MAATFQCQIVGAGAAGLSLMIAIYNQQAAASDSSRPGIEKLLDSLVMLDASDAAGGVMSSYQINANTDAVDVVSGIAPGTPFSPLRDSYLELGETSQELISLPRIGELILQPLVQKMSHLLGNRLKFNSPVAKIIIERGKFISLDRNHQTVARSKNLVLCCGGREVLLPELADWQNKIRFASDFLRLTSLDKLPPQAGCIVIAGSSHSAFSCAWRLLNDPLFKTYALGRQIFILQRSKLVKLRCTPEFARQHELPYDVKDDVCPVTGLVYRHGGLRKDAKALYLKIKSGEEKRVRIISIKILSHQSELLDQSALILQCTGFHPDWPEIEIDGKNCRLDEHSKRGELYDVDSAKKIPGLFACGLGMRIKPESKFGGEKSFNGSVDGLQSYPLVIAPQIIDQILRALR